MKDKSWKTAIAASVIGVGGFLITGWAVLPIFALFVTLGAFGAFRKTIVPLLLVAMLAVPAQADKPIWQLSKARYDMDDGFVTYFRAVFCAGIGREITKHCIAQTGLVVPCVAGGAFAAAACMFIENIVDMNGEPSDNMYDLPPAGGRPRLDDDGPPIGETEKK